MFGCVQKFSAGTSGKFSNYGKELFTSEEKVDGFLTNRSKRPSSKTTVCEPTDFLFLLFCVLSVYSNLLLPTTHATTQPLQ